MSRPPQSDTIAAIATALGEGGISVIRISGPQAIQIASKGFRSKQLLEGAASHTAHYGSFRDPHGNNVDEVVATIFLEPNSFTGENVAEISCHGGPFVTRRILEALVKSGARHAEPGEFTKRAFLNGKLDLTQAEAVADIIRSRSDLAHRASYEQLRGRLSSEIAALRESLIHITGLLEIELDFVEDDLEFVDRKMLMRLVDGATERIDKLIRSFGTGKIIRDGMRVVLAGAPNVGKSSLLNALLNEDRAIVTEVPGTTRDVIEESFVTDGLAIRLIDTAGVRTTDHVVEVEGIRRSEQQVRNCDILLLVLDSSRHLEEIDLLQSRRLLADLKPPTSGCILIMNKSDLTSQLTIDELEEVDFFKGWGRIHVSALRSSGLDELRKALVSSVAEAGKWSREGDVLVTHQRHHDALLRAQKNLGSARESLAAGASNEFLAVDIRGALDNLGEIVGTVTTDDILNDIFSKFCIGK